MQDTRILQTVSCGVNCAHKIASVHTASDNALELGRKPGAWNQVVIAYCRVYDSSTVGFLSAQEISIGRVVSEGWADFYFL